MAGSQTDFSTMSFGNGASIEAYPSSINEVSGVKLFIGRESGKKYLYVMSPKAGGEIPGKFEGEDLSGLASNGKSVGLKRCEMNHRNARSLQELFPFTRATAIGLRNSYGFGDRLGLANPGHLRALKGYNFKPVLAQQSIRELTRTQRTPEEVMDAAVWAVFQEGYKDGFGADADHLKTTDDVDRLVEAGFTMFTIDPSDHVVNGVTELSQQELSKKVSALPWKDFGDTYERLLGRYKDKTTKLDSAHSITATEREVQEACLKYMAAIINIRKIHSHLKTKHAKYSCEIEVSIDETDTVTTPFEHFFIVS
ncbi:MAG: hypothetical protein B7Z63_01475, partial [Ignavibacteriae bacterium 37-53-5]